MLITGGSGDLIFGAAFVLDFLICLTGCCPAFAGAWMLPPAVSNSSCFTCTGTGCWCSLFNRLDICSSASWREVADLKNGCWASRRGLFALAVPGLSSSVGGALGKSRAGGDVRADCGRGS